MKKANTERARLRALSRCALVSSGPEPAYDNIVRVAAEACGTPIAAVTLITAEFQCIKAAYGLRDAGRMPRSLAFCDHTIRSIVPLEVHDAGSDARFVDHPMVANEPHVRFYYGHPLIDADGHALGALCVLDHAPRRLDERQRTIIAQLAQVTVALIDSRRRAREGAQLAASVDHDDDEIYVVREPDLHVQFMNARARAAARLKGLQVPQDWGFELRRVVGWTDIDAALLTMQRLHRHGRTHAELETIDAFGPGVHRQVRLQMSRYQHDDEHSILIRVKDLTERRALEAAVDEIQDRWRFAIDACEVGVIDWNFETGTGHASVHARKLAGLPESACGTMTRTMWERRVHPADLARVLDTVDAHLCAETPSYDVQYRLLRHDRQALQVRERGRVLRRSPQGVPQRMVVVQQELGASRADVPAPEVPVHAPAPSSPRTDRRDARAASSASEEIAALRQQIELLTTSLAHDVRAPLHALKAFLDETAKHAPQTARSDDFTARLAVARNASARLEQLVRGLIGYARSGRSGASRDTVVDARAVFAAAWADLASTRNNIEFRLGALPLVAADTTLLRTVADNLLSNAIKYMGAPDRGLIEVDATDAPDGSGDACIRVQDNGMGFPAEQAHRLFEPFQRLHPQPHLEGIGLGLASVRAVVERLGGRCGAMNNPHGGATFWFTLPRANQAADVAGQQASVHSPALRSIDRAA